MSEPVSNVISLATGDRVTDMRGRKEYCIDHWKSVVVDRHLRQIRCSACGGVIEAFDWAVKMAAEESVLMGRIDTLKTELSERLKKVDELKADEQRIKARIRSAKESLLKSAGV